MQQIVERVNIFKAAAIGQPFPDFTGEDLQGKQIRLSDCVKGKEYVCFPSCETNIDGIYKENERVVVSDHIITSKAAGTTFDFAFAIIKYLANEEVANMVLHNVYYK